MLRVLRKDLNSTLPVEIFWHGGAEMDAASLAALQRELGPIEGGERAAGPVHAAGPLQYCELARCPRTTSAHTPAVDATKLPLPGHHLPNATLKGFPMKPFALLNTRCGGKTTSAARLRPMQLSWRPQTRAGTAGPPCSGAVPSSRAWWCAPPRRAVAAAKRPPPSARPPRPRDCKQVQAGAAAGLRHAAAPGPRILVRRAAVQTVRQHALGRHLQRGPVQN